MRPAGITLDAGALQAFEDALRRSNHSMSDHVGVWARDKTIVSTPSLAWAEYWRGRGPNVHFIAQLRKRVRVEPVILKTAESAADALRSFPPTTSRNNVKHLIDAIVMSHANQFGDAVYTADTGDFEPLWDQFGQVKALVSAVTGHVICRR